MKMGSDIAGLVGDGVILPAIKATAADPRRKWIGGTSRRRTSPHGIPVGCHRLVIATRTAGRHFVLRTRLDSVLSLGGRSIAASRCGSGD